MVFAMIDNLKLIELVQEKEFLYNKGLNEFRMTDLKEAAWQEIAEKLGSTEADVKKRWSSLRDRFTKEIRMRIRAEEGKLMLTKDPWSLYDAMYFVKDHIKYNTYNDNSFTQPKTVQYEGEEEFIEPSYVEFKPLDNIAEEDEFTEATPRKKFKESLSDDEQSQNDQPEEIEVQTAVERIEPSPRLPNAQVLGISRIVIHKLNNLDTVLQNESIETILSYLSAMERFQAGLVKTKPNLRL